MQDTLMSLNFFEAVSGKMKVSGGDINQYSPLVFAYLGDAVYEVFVRMLVVSQGNAPVHIMHKRSVSFVKAKAQSETIHRILEKLAPEEQDVVRRGRNAKSATVPKNADVTEYRYATGFEALLGYLYLKGDYDRLSWVLNMTTEKVEEPEKEALSEENSTDKDSITDGATEDDSAEDYSTKDAAIKEDVIKETTIKEGQADPRSMKERGDSHEGTISE